MSSAYFLVLIEMQQTYLTLIAKAVYFLPNAEPITLQLKTFQQRLWMKCVVQIKMRFLTC